MVVAPAAVLAQDEARRAGADLLGEERQVGGQVLEEPVLVNAGFRDEQVVAYHRFVRRRVEAGEPGDQPAELVQVGRVHVALRAVLVVVQPEGHDDLFQSSVAGPLADAVDRPLDDVDPLGHAGQGVGRGQA